MPTNLQKFDVDEYVLVLQAALSISTRICRYQATKLECSETCPNEARSNFSLEIYFDCCGKLLRGALNHDQSHNQVPYSM